MTSKVRGDRQVGHYLTAARLADIRSSAEALLHATDHDVLVAYDQFRMTDGRVPGSLVAHAWLSEPIPAGDLVRRVGGVTAECLASVQAIELLGLGPVPAGAHNAVCGRYRLADDRGAHFQTVGRVLSEWRDNLAATKDLGGWLSLAGTAQARVNSRDMLAHFAIQFVPVAAHAVVHDVPAGNFESVAQPNNFAQQSVGDNELAQAA